MPLGSKLLFKEKLIDYIIKLDELGEKISSYKIVIDNNNFVNDNLTLMVASPHDLNGKFIGNITVNSSTRKEFLDSNLIKDINNNFAILGDRKQFSWDVKQVAQVPEFKNDSIYFDSDDYSLKIPFRRGINTQGYRNPKESMNVTISNIPAGYILAEKINGEFRSIGATDKFGTLTILGIGSLPEGTDQNEIAEYNYLNQGNLFLVKKDQGVEDINKVNLLVGIMSNIVGLSNSDNKSQINYQNIKAELNNNNAPNLINKNEFVDPLIISFNDDGIIELSDLNDNKNDLRFEMIPGFEKIKNCLAFI